MGKLKEALMKVLRAPKPKNAPKDPLGLKKTRGGNTKSAEESQKALEEEDERTRG